MYNVVIADDQPFARIGMRSIVNWQEYGFKVVGDAENGEEALQLIYQYKPELIITDIRMPLLDGLELTKKIKEFLPDSQILVMSAYDEFNYAQKAIELGVLGYLLKPVVMNDLLQFLVKVRDILEKKKKDEIEEQHIREQLEKSMPLLQEQYYNELVNGQYQDNLEREEKEKFLDIKIPERNLVVLVFDIDDFRALRERTSFKETELLKIRLLKIVRNIIDRYCEGVVFSTYSNNYVAVLKLETIHKHSFMNKIMFITEEIRKSINNDLNITITIGISRWCDSIKHIKIAYDEAFEATRYKSIIGKNSVISIEEVEPKKDMESIITYPIAKEQEVIFSLKMGEKSLLETRLEEFFEDMLGDKNVSMEYVAKASLELVFVVSRVLVEMGESIEKIFGNHFFPNIQVTKFETVEDIKIWVKGILFKVSEHIQDSKRKRYRKEIKLALDYINKNYMKEIDLKKVAGELMISTYYLSHIWKKELETSFISYINELRIDKAKELINTTTYKVYEIAEMVGYNDRKYFTKIFKQYMGVTPSEYCKSS